MTDSTAMVITDQRQFTVKEIRAYLGSDPVWARHAILALYARQTQDEQATEATLEHNERGFTGGDARMLTSFARQILYGKTLTPKQLAVAYRKLPKYARQLWEVGQAQHPDRVSAKPGPRK